MLEEGMLQFALLGAEWVLYLLVLLSLGCFGITLERVYYLTRDGTAVGSLKEAVNGYLGDGDLSAFTARLAKLRGFEVRVLSAGIEMAIHGPVAAERAMSGTVTAEKLRMERGLSFLATVGSNAPFIGLFGTVLGIMKAFNDLAENMSEASTSVMAGISEALVATAVGLAVAIPAVVLYNLFTRWVKGRLGRSESLAQLVLARIEGETSAHGR